MSTFKVGDKVRAVSSGHHQITKGEVYTVVEKEYGSYGGTLVYVLGNNGKKAGQYEYRFEPVEELVFAPGARVKIKSPWCARGYGHILAWRDEGRHTSIPVAHDTWHDGHSGYNETKPSAYAFETNVWFYAPEYLELTPETRRFIVILEKDGQLLPATKPREYATREQAEHVAKDMTKKHSDTFYVFESTFIAKPVKKVVETVEAEGVKL